MTLHGTDRDEFLSRLAAFAAAFPTRAPGGRPAFGELELAQHDGRRFRARCYYEAGLPDEETVETGGSGTWVRFQLALYGPDPFWYAAEPVTLFWDYDEPLAFLGSPFLPLRLSPSQVIGDAVLTNPGSESALGVWRVTGPGTDFIATNTSSGEVLRVTGSIPDGQTLTIVTAPATADISLQPAGTDWWPNLDDDEQTLWEIPPGATSAALTLSGAATGSRIELEFTPRWAWPW